MTEISFDATPSERALARDCAVRAQALIKKHGGKPRPLMQIEMDLVATHANGCPLDFGRLREADDFNFSHDVFGIERHLDRTTGTLGDCFLPRFSRRCQDVEARDPEAMKLTVARKRIAYENGGTQ